ncbi:MAG: glycosyltransferase [Planctomycetota bacterium]
MQSVIVSTYNKPRHLALVLEGLLRQRDAEFEVIVADDGSTAETTAVIENFAARAPFRVEHVWQEDLGFRAARIRNLGVKAARGAELVFLDGDCIPFADFLAAHHRAARPDRVLAGDRLFLDEKPSALVTEREIADPGVSALVPSAETRRLRWRAAKSRFYALTGLKERPKVVTANLSMARSAFEAVNGLDERFVGWGHEDDDLRRRLRRRGFRISSVCTTARVCHLWHPHVPSFRGKVKFGDNAGYFERGFFLSRCRTGLAERRVQDLKIAWNGEHDGTLPLELNITWGTTPVFCAAEISVFVTSQSAPIPTTAIARANVFALITSQTTGELPNTHHGKPCIALTAPLDPATPAGRAALLNALESIL